MTKVCVKSLSIQKNNPSPIDKFSIADECDMVLIGYLVIFRPAKRIRLEELES